MHWFELTLSKGPKLIYKRPDRNEKPLAVTNGAAEYLFTNVKLDSDVTLGDVLGLLDNPIMRTVYRREFVNELLAEASFGPVVSDEPEHQKLEYIELNQIWNLDSATKEFTSIGQFSVSGKSHLLTEDVVEGGSLLYKAGERIRWSISMTSVRELLHIPVRVQSAVQICEEDVFAKRFGHAIQSGVNYHITLGTLIQALLWELSWHGTPAERDARRADLVETRADIDAGTAKTVPYSWGSFGRLPTNEVYPQVFDYIEGASFEAIESAIRDLEDGEFAQMQLMEVFDGCVKLKDEFVNLTGRELRIAIDEASRPASQEALLESYDSASAYAAEDKAWDQMVPVGCEFGSPDFERLMEEDAKAFQDNISSLIDFCAQLTKVGDCDISNDKLADVINVQAALGELGHIVSESVAVSVWKHYSSSLAASWMSGAHTVDSAKRALFLYCSGEPKAWSNFVETRIQPSSTYRLPVQERDFRMNLQNHHADRTHKQVIVLRKDLNMRKGKMVAQGAHASMKAVIDTGSIEQADGRRTLIIPLENDSVGPWLFGKFAKVTVSVDSEEELLALHKDALARGLVCALIQDAGLTEFGGVPTYTALAIGPHRNEVFEDITGHLKLL